MKLFVATVAAVMTLSVAHAEILTPERVFASPDLSGPQAKGVALAPDGSAVTYLKAKTDDVDVNDLWIADVKVEPAGFINILGLPLRIEAALRKKREAKPARGKKG